jgi:hypothetical protein
MNLGQHIVDSVVEAGAIERMIEDKDGGSMIFVWSSNANEQVEAAFLKRMQGEIERFSMNRDNRMAIVYAVGQAQAEGHSPDRIAGAILNAAVKMFLEHNK